MLLIQFNKQIITKMNKINVEIVWTVVKLNNNLEQA